MSDYAQQVIIGVIVFAALISVLRRMMPKWSRARQQSLARWLDRDGRGKGLRALGRWLAPAQGSGGCGSCNTCSSCGTAPAADQAKKNDQSAAKPLEFRRHP